MADVQIQQTCINLQAGGRCCLVEEPCPYASSCHTDSPGTDSETWRTCGDARVAARVNLAPDEFMVLLTADGRPRAGKFPLRRCRATTLEESAGVHTTSLLTSRGDAALLDEIEMPNGTILLTTRDGNASLLWKAGKFVPA